MECQHHMDQDSKKHCLTHVPIFNHLSDEELVQVAKTSRSKQFTKGEMIFHAGEPSHYLYIVHRGKVKISRTDESGKEQIIRILEPGDFLGELSLFTFSENENDAFVMMDSDICMIHRQDIHQLLRQYPNISVKILEEFSYRLDKTEKLVSQLTSKDAEKRIASYLIDLSKEQNDQTTITLPMTRKDLASYLGAAQETISRKLSSFQERGWIKQKGQKQIQIVDFHSLTKIVESE